MLTKVLKLRNDAFWLQVFANVMPGAATNRNLSGLLSHVVACKQVRS